MALIALTITLNAVDVTALQTGQISVSMQEGAARTASFTISPATGAIDPHSYMGQAVTIDYGATRIFTGIVDNPQFDIAAGLLTLSCTDALQEVFELVDRAAIDLMLPGYWSDVVFQEVSDNWSYAQKVMSTYPGSYDKSPAGVGRVTDWQPKVTVDKTFTESTIISGSLSYSWASRRGIVNSVKINIDHRYKRKWQREVGATWSLGFNSGNWELFLDQQFPMPEKKAIEGAAAGWTIKNIAYTNPPPTGSYGTPPRVWQQTDYTLTLCTDAVIDLAARWVQDVTDSYTITISSAASIAQYGLLEITQDHGITQTDHGEFLDFDAYQAPQGTNIEPGNWLDFTSGDISNDMLAAMHYASTQILSKHRENFATFSCEIDPALDVSDTVRVNTAKNQATGKVVEVTHVIDTSEGNASATTECKIAVYLPNAAGQTNDALAATASPHVTPTGLVNSLPALSTRVGGIETIPADDPTWNGWTTNYYVQVGASPVVYNQRFSYEIADNSEVAAVAFNSVSAFNVAIPQTEFVMSK